MLIDKLSEYAQSGVYPMHMPGHKRNTPLLSQYGACADNWRCTPQQAYPDDKRFTPQQACPDGRAPSSCLPYALDITEIHGFDDLYDPHGLLLETAQLAAKLYGSKEAFPLVNGSTVGILTAIGAHAKRGDKILIAANCHRSVTNAAALFGLTPVFLRPEIYGGTGVACSIDPAAVEAALAAEPDIRIIVITSPTYEGAISDISSISAIAHRHGAILAVDSAHGAHLGFSSFFQGSAVRGGADVVVMSLHKTLPALTQCSLLHACSDRANAAEMKRLLSVLQTSSPSYVLMASIDQCLRLMASDGDRLFGEHERLLKHFFSDIDGLKNLSVLNANGLIDGFYLSDPGRIVIVTKNTTISGFALADILRAQYLIELEAAHEHYAIAITSACDTAGGFERLANALVEIDKREAI